MAKTDWTIKDTVKPADMNEIGREINELRTASGYGVTSNNGNAYDVTLSPAPSTLTVGIRVAVKINATSTGSPTLNVNGLGAKPLLKASGTPASLKENGVYTFVFDGSAFIIQGEGGEYGTADAEHVLTGKTIGTEDGIVQGTMPNRSGISTDNVGITTGGDGNLWFNTPAGYYDPTGSVRGYDADFISNNIALGKNIFGVNGSVPRYTRKDVYGDARYLGPGEVYQVDTVGSPQYGYYLVMNLRMTGTNGRLVIRKISSKETVAEVGNPDKILGIMFSPGSLDLAILYGSSPSYSYATLISNQYNSGEGWEIVLIGDVGGTSAINTFRGSSIGVRDSF